MRSRPPRFGDLYELHVSLRHIEPAVWRRIRVPAEIPLGVLHDVLQLAFGWQDSHLHDFEVGTIRFAAVDVENEIFAVDEDAAPLGGVARVGTKLVYRYDYGDDWEHDVKVERIVEGDGPELVCLGGARACPPEDSGGAPGYEEMLAVLAKPKHPEHAEIKEWLGPRFDPERFDLVVVNKRLAALAKQIFRPRSKR